MDRRRELLLDLIEARRPAHEVRAELRRFAWDSPQLVELGPEHVAKVLQRYLRREWSATDVEAWAEALEGRDDVGYSPGARERIADALHELSTPEVSGPLTDEVASRWLEALRARAD